MIENTPKAIRKLICKVDNPETALAICEASGGYERHVLDCCADAGLPVRRAYGTRTRKFARLPGLAPPPRRSGDDYGDRAEPA